MKRIAILGGIVAASIGLAGCTSQQEQTTLTAIQTTCAILPIGASLTVAVAAAAAPGIVPVVQTFSAISGPACNALLSQVQNAITAINGQGSAAAVTVTTTSTKTSAVMRDLAKKLGATKVTTTTHSITFVVPAPVVPGLPF